ncbi:MAG: glycosyltransferase [Bradyrhizobium sp.]|uniref:glycosyltransferase n=1 Tax=Bradyrhizobium sp. TaxID=376 RepID=UPI001C284176|nr:glycosyltransferase family A protein [Bradyrhizobium sp.]MBU6462572.1 glycosyltransferase [Pseudomonadota bacterium]MDE2067193.1 glycosyltransferase [Bradyrhizobium sp.]MDE2468348.1 glycosyltransferase [Bradyrhizobium sp.]
MELALSIAWLAFVMWLILRAYAQRDLLPVAQPNGSAPIEALARVSVIIPARNESANITRCLNSLLQQTYPADLLNIIVVDDHSTDATFRIASSLARQWPQLQAIRSPPLPPHWIGKCHACWFGANNAPPDCDWICFLDADVVAAPDLVRSALAAAQMGELDLLSLVPRQRLGSFAERLIIPCGLYLMAFSQDLATVQAQQSDKVVASGQFMLIRKEAYDSAAGHAAVHDVICEDVGLALLIKRGGGRVMLQDGRSLLSARMYVGWSSLWSGLSKNLVETLGGPAATLATIPAVVVLSLASLLLPALAGISCAQGSTASCIALVPAGLGTAAAFGLHIAGSLYFDIPFWYGLLFPLGYAIGACLAIESLRRRWRGRIVWKGRTYP